VSVPIPVGVVVPGRSGTIGLVFGRELAVDEFVEHDGLLEFPQTLNAIAAVDPGGGLWFECAAKLLKVACLSRLRRFVAGGVEIAKDLLDRGDVFLRCLLVYRGPRVD
jgi:hypothetical protein